MASPPHFRQNDVERVVADIFSGGVAVAIERVSEGVSTYVYRVHRGPTTYYLRVLPEADASFAPEVRVHMILRERGVRVPEVVHWEHCNPVLSRSVMATTEIRGRSISTHMNAQTLSPILVEAGRDLARVNAVPVAGFGWIKRDTPSVAALEAEQQTYRAFAHEQMERHLASLNVRGVLGVRDIAAIRAILDQYCGYLEVQDASLAHGDFDATHIYHDMGRYTGIIDFGEIRGADPLYDLGHVFMENRLLLRGLLAGYHEQFPLPDDYWQRIHFDSLHIRIRRAARDIEIRQDGQPYPGTVACIRENIAALLD